MNLAPVLREVASLLRDTLPKNIEIHVEIPSDSVPPVLGDSTQLHQVLLNLCLNARDAMSSGGSLSFSFSVISYAEEGRPKDIQVVVADTGHGMSPEVQARIFNPFFTTKAVGQGTGLGLSTSHTIIQDHGGRILVEFTPGKGTCFTVILPILAEKGPEGSTPEKTPAAQANGETILVLDA